MIRHFLKLEWKQFFRSSYFGKSIALKIIMGFFALYMLASFLMIGIGTYFIIEKEYPSADPLLFVNGWLIFVLVGDLIFRYLMQKLPVLNIKPLLNLPVKKEKLVHFVLRKSAFSFFNLMPLFFYVPFSIVLIGQGYNVPGVLGWLFLMFTLVLSANYINFLINKNNYALGIMIAVLGSLFLVNKYEIFSITDLFAPVFQSVYNNPVLSLIGVFVLVGVYYVNFKLLRSKVYLDDAIKSKEEVASSADLSFVDKLGDVAPFIKNDIRQIWRNKRTKTVFFMSFIFLFYGTIFFGEETYRVKMPAFLVFAAIFVTGGFTLNYGQFIPAWDSEYYNMIMSQNIRYRKFLESKWYLMVVVSLTLYLLSIPYAYFYGLDIFLMITAGAIFNIGFNSLFLLFAGSFNRKRIDLNKSGFSNYQGTSATQFLIIIPIMGVPMLLFWVFNKFVSFNAGVLAIAIAGVLALAFKNYFMNLIENRYIQNKYAAIHAFSQKS
ncbi:DUF5687 family protein [Tenacibaculum caenipelagi]|uniref:ABC-2 type transport system permease protein n=1 Tax=Tenacibaculum caenipelagi TaxID=1325435 RepID=A0A4R6TE59_9FLAO|nr:DUF5687 family protein [Tenacibaculum caenipelagi]TDQ28565.1 hypothetical protein DFQ07_0941 [Tenacibaculum caenipelagi]